MTGAEALQKIMDTVDALTSTVNELKMSVQLIEANIKVLNNRAAGLMRDGTPVIYPTTGSRLTDTVGIPMSAGAPVQKTQEVIQTSSPSRGRQMIETPEETRTEAMNFIKDDNSPGVMTYKKVYGKLVNNTNEPIENVLIKVYDKNNEVCATTETDPIGYWETMLKPGRYVAEYVKSGFKTANKTFEVGKNAKEIEVK